MTLGFRGEALASICAVSKVDVLTKRPEEDYGTHYVIEGAVEKTCESAAVLTARLSLSGIFFIMFLQD